MSLSDCPKCWDTPCTCGHEYANYSITRLVAMRDMFQRIIDKKQKARETERKIIHEDEH